MLKVSAVPPRRSAVLTVFRGIRRSMTEPLRNHGDHGGATAVYAIQALQWHRASGVTGVLGCKRVEVVIRSTVSRLHFDRDHVRFTTPTTLADCPVRAL